MEEWLEDVLCANLPKSIFCKLLTNNILCMGTAMGIYIYLIFALSNDTFLVVGWTNYLHKINLRVWKNFCPWRRREGWKAGMFRGGSLPAQFSVAVCWVCVRCASRGDRSSAVRAFAAVVTPQRLCFPGYCHWKVDLSQKRCCNCWHVDKCCLLLHVSSLFVWSRYAAASHMLLSLTD